MANAGVLILLNENENLGLATFVMSTKHSGIEFYHKLLIIVVVASKGELFSLVLVLSQIFVYTHINIHNDTHTNHIILA